MSDSSFGEARPAALNESHQSQKLFEATMSAPAETPALNLIPENPDAEAYLAHSRVVSKATAIVLGVTIVARTVLNFIAPDYTDMPTRPQHFEVFPVTVEANGFGPAEYTPGVLEGTLLVGWQRLGLATRGVVSKDVSVRVNPTRTMKVPGITEVPDLCNEEARRGFRDKVMDAITSTPDVRTRTERTTTVVVVEQEAYPKCVAADAGPEVGMMIYDGGTFSTEIAEHEDGHLSGVGHEGRLDCPNPETIDDSCTAIEYGNWYNAMGDQAKPDDIDTLSGYALYRIGTIRPEDVTTIKDGAIKSVTLYSVNETPPQGSGTSLIRIPMVGKGDPSTNPQACFNNIFIELSSDRPPQADYESALSLKASATDTRQILPNSYLLPFAEKLSAKTFQTYKLDWEPEGKISFTIGNTTVTIDGYRRPRPSREGKGNVTFTVSAASSFALAPAGCSNPIRYLQ